jgi:hypothetical protein
MVDTTGRFGGAAGPAQPTGERDLNRNRGASPATGERAKESTEGGGGVVEAVKEKAHDVATDASELAGKVKDTAQEWASTVGDAAVQAKNKVRDVASTAVETVGSFGQDVTALIRRYPLPALLLSAGAGFLLGMVLGRSADRS